MPDDSRAGSSTLSFDADAPRDDRLTLLTPAIAAHRQGDYARAETLYQQALALDPTLVACRVWRAALYLRTDRLAQAQAEIERARRLDAEATEATLVAATSEYGDDDSLSSLRGWWVWQAGQVDEARGWFEQALRQNPTSVGARTWLPQLTAEQQAETPLVVPEPVQRLEQLRGYLNEADRLSALGNLPGAIEQLETARRDYPLDEEVRERLQELRAHQRRARQIEQYRQAAEQAEHGGDLPGAIQRVRHAIDLDPLDDTLLAWLQALERRQNVTNLVNRARRMGERDLERAWAILQEAFELDPDNQEVATLRAELEARRQEAQQKAARAERARHAVATAEAALDANDWQTALNLVAPVLREDPDHADAREAQRKAEALRQAIDRLLEDVAAFAPQQPDQARAALGQAAGLGAEPALVERWHAEIKRQEELQRAEIKRQEELQRAEIKRQEELQRAEIKRREERQRAEALLDQAQRAYDADKRDEALALLREAHALMPDDRRLREWLDAWEKERDRRRPTPIPPQPVVTPPPEPAGPDRLVGAYVAQAESAWQTRDRAGCASAARQAYELWEEATESRPLALRAGLVWLGLSLAGRASLTEGETVGWRRVAAHIADHDTPLRADFNAHLLVHLAQAILLKSNYPLENLALPGNTPQAPDRRLVEWVIARHRLDNDRRQQLDADLAGRVVAPLGEAILTAVQELVSRPT